MEKPIETIWKEGFLKSDALIAPKLNDLYNRKSEHIVDKFTRMFKINLKAIFIGSFAIVGMAFLVQIPYMGLMMFVLLNALVVINKKLLKGLFKIDKNVSSFQFLKTFDDWMKDQISTNEKFARVLYPVAFLSILTGFWFGSLGGDVPGEILVNELITTYPDMILVLGLPLYGLLGVLLVIGLLILFSNKIYRFDLGLVYGRILKKMDEMILDMEELRA